MANLTTNLTTHQLRRAVKHDEVRSVRILSTKAGYQLGFSSLPMLGTEPDWLLLIDDTGEPATFATVRHAENILRGVEWDGPITVPGAPGGDNHDS